MYFNMWQAGMQLQKTLLIILSSAPSSDQISGSMPVCRRKYRLRGYSCSKTINVLWVTILARAGIISRPLLRGEQESGGVNTRINYNSRYSAQNFIGLFNRRGLPDAIFKTLPTLPGL
jgi:hypothetical protein